MKGPGNQLHPIAYEDQPHWPQILNYKKKPTMSVVHEHFSLLMVLSTAITIRGPGMGKGRMCHDSSSFVLPRRWTWSRDPWEAPCQAGGFAQACVLALAVVSSPSLGFFFYGLSMTFSSVLTRDCNETSGVNLWTVCLSWIILSFVKVVQKKKSHVCNTFFGIVFT